VTDRAPISRRGLFRTGGATITLGALVAACNDSTVVEPGRVGNAPVVTPLPDEVINDVVLVRTATSLEYTLLAIYERLSADGYFGADEQELVDRLVENHIARAAELAELTAELGGEPYECANSFLMARFVEPTMLNIEGDDEQGIEPSDDPARDARNTAEAWESLGGATYQNMVSTLADPAVREQLIAIGAEEVRQAATWAMRITGTPEGYLSPALVGDEVEPDESGFVPVYAISSAFGSLAPITLTVGAPNDVGVRFSVLLQTPAENSFVYEGETCDA
jgi:hypothetical protein